MRYIDLSKLDQVAKDIGWDVIKEKHYNALNNLNTINRKKYINGHSDWSKLKPGMQKLSDDKCWYTEAKIGNGEFDVDHFRPKNKADYFKDYTNPKSEKVVLKKDGYWWKAYDLDNYRLSGSLSNKRRKDILGDTDEVKGKGTYFPLDLQKGKVAEDGGDISCEFPILLDPTVKEDVDLLTFDNGYPIPATENEDDVDRVKQSIFYYHLDLESLNTARQRVWNACLRHIYRAKKAIDPQRDINIELFKASIEELKELLKPESEHTSTAKACLLVNNVYSWIEN